MRRCCVACVGWYVFVGLGVMFLVGPITSRFSKVMIQSTYAKMRLSDERAKVSVPCGLHCSMQSLVCHVYVLMRSCLLRLCLGLG